MNGKVAIATHNAQSRRGARGRTRPLVDLAAGWNQQILFKITQGGGGWGFYSL